MLILRLFISCVLLVQSAICSGSTQDVNEKTNKQLQEETQSYEYRHPPLQVINERESRKGKSIVNKNISSPVRRSHSVNAARKTRPEADKSSLKVPVEVVYDKELNPGHSYKNPTATSSSNGSTRVVVRRKLLQSNRNKNIDIRQTKTETSTVDSDMNTTENARIIKDVGSEGISSSTEFSKRSRGSYFKKRTEFPAPKVKILEEKNFVYAHSGNFHYSFLGDDGTKVSSEGSLRSYDNNKTGEAVSGSVFYKDEEGNDFSLTYTADENGYRPVGAHLPTPPPLPPAIARALKYIADKSTPPPLVKNE